MYVCVYVCMCACTQTLTEFIFFCNVLKSPDWAPVYGHSAFMELYRGGGGRREERLVTTLFHFTLIQTRAVDNM